MKILATVIAVAIIAYLVGSYVIISRSSDACEDAGGVLVRRVARVCVRQGNQAMRILRTVAIPYKGCEGPYSCEATPDYIASIARNCRLAPSDAQLKGKKLTGAYFTWRKE